MKGSPVRVRASALLNALQMGHFCRAKRRLQALWGNRLGNTTLGAMGERTDEDYLRRVGVPVPEQRVNRPC